MTITRELLQELSLAAYDDAVDEGLDRLALDIARLSRPGGNRATHAI